MQFKKISLKPVTDFIVRLTDMRFAGQVGFVIIVLLVSYSGVKTIETNYGLQKQISALKQKNEVQKLENQNLALQTEYYGSSQYLELAARQDLGLGLPGETEVIVPVEVAKNYTINVDVTPRASKAKRNPTIFERNLSSWFNFFFNRTAED